MATQVKHRRGTNAEILAGVPAIGELWFNTTDNSIHMGDGVTLGGIKHVNENTLSKYTDFVFNNVSDLSLSTLLKSGDNVRTSGFYAAGDGGDGLYIIGTETPNGMSVIDVGGGLSASLINYHTIEQLGAVANDNTSVVLTNRDVIAHALDKYNVVNGKSVENTYYFECVQFNPKTEMVWSNGVFQSVNDAAYLVSVGSVLSDATWFAKTGDKIRGVRFKDVRFYGDSSRVRSFINCGKPDTDAWVNFSLEGRVYIGGFKIGLGVHTWTSTFNYLRLENCDCPAYVVGTSFSGDQIYQIGMQNAMGLGIVWDEVAGDWDEADFGNGLSYSNIQNIANDQISEDGFTIGRVNGVNIGSIGTESEFTSGYVFRLLSNTRGVLKIGNGVFFNNVPIFKDETTTGSFVVEFTGEIRETTTLFTADSTRAATVIVNSSVITDDALFTQLTRTEYSPLIGRPVETALAQPSFKARAANIAGRGLLNTFVASSESQFVWNNGEEIYAKFGPGEVAASAANHRIYYSSILLRVSTLYDGGGQRVDGECIIDAFDYDPATNSTPVITNLSGNADGTTLGVTKTYDANGDMKLSVRCRLPNGGSGTQVFFAEMRTIGGALRGDDRYGLTE